MKQYSRHKALPFLGLQARRLLKSIWLFPAILTLVLALLTTLQVSGSSMGVYHLMFYGPTKDQHLLANHPRDIRSDEWLVNSQMSIAQKNNNYARFNQNIGNGEDVSIMVDVPYKEWSILFKPHNLAYFVMPFNNAFAFSWWVKAYLLVLSCYFFTLALLPKRRLLAALLGIGLLCSPFVQWWYLYGTLGTMYYTLFGGAILVQILRQKRLGRAIWWGGLLAYVATCLAFVLYPPFQIPCALAMLAFAVGYVIEQFKAPLKKLLWQKLTIVVAALVIAGAITGIFVATRLETVRTMTDTAYPGARIQKSGDFDAVHLFAGQLGRQLKDTARVSAYRVSSEPTNQSEASNFLLLLPFLILPAIYLLWRSYKEKKQLDWPLALVSITFIVALIWLFVPGLSVLGKVTLLERVPHLRLLIGLGLLNTIMVILFIRRYMALKEITPHRRLILGYALIIFLIELALAQHIRHQTPDFLSFKQALAYSLPLPLATYFLLRRQYTWAAGVLTVFSFLMVMSINPLYHGTGILSSTPVSTAIREVASHDPSAFWATEYFTLENFVSMNGVHSLSGVYAYPQLTLWRSADPTASEDTYNRYAHTNFIFDRDASRTVDTKATLPGPDHLSIVTEPCSTFLRDHSVRYLLASDKLNVEDSCATIERQIDYPAITFYIYRLH